MNQATARPITLADLGREPFRIFFPAAVLAGIVGVALWPLHFGGVVALYPGQAHARIMADGLFGGFILGFLGTAMPRMLSAPPLGTWKVLLLVGIHLGMVGCFAAGKIGWGDQAFLALLVIFILLMANRARQRQDTPPPGFVLVGLAWLCVLAGTGLAVWQHYEPELDSYWVVLQRLLSYQGFVLLPILGIGPFILPRFFGMQSPHDFPEMRIPTTAWIRKAALAVAVGGVIIGSFFLEASGWHRAAHAVRFLATLVYFVLEFPLRRAPGAGNALGASLRIALVVLAGGFLVIALFPAHRVGLLHLTLVGGFAIITFVVATRVVYGHSGNLERLKGRNRWLLVAVILMLFALATRISGDFWPAIMASHYIYGALLWVAGVLVWGCYVLPKVFWVENE